MNKHTRKHRRAERSYYSVTTSSYQPGQPADPDQPFDEPPRKKRRWLKRLLVLLILTPLVAALVIGVWDYRNFSGASRTLFGNTNVLELWPSMLESTEQGRVNLMLVGYSADDPGHGGALLTDSILIVSLNPATKTGYMLSVPRDLYVDIPDYGQAKINEAYQAGERSGFRATGYSPGGLGLLEQIIDDTFGIEVHYNALVNYTAVREVVNALDGINVTVKSPDPRGLYDPNFRPIDGGPLKLKNGPQEVDGQTALKLTRARGATYGSYGFPLSDFNRTQNQQQVFLGIQKELNWQLVLDPRTNGKIFKAAADNVRTNVKLSEVIPLYRLFTRVQGDKLTPVSLREVNGVNYLVGYTTPSGQSALIPAAGVNNYSEIRSVLKKLDLK